MSDDFDLKKYELTDEHLAELKKVRGKTIITAAGAELEQERKRKRARQFIKVPMSWADCLFLVPARHAGGTYRIALAFLRRQWERQTSTFTLSNKVAAEIGLPPRTKWRALRELELLGLVKIDRRSRKSPVVTIVSPQQVTDL
jgi:hypothetical protein